MKTFSRSLLVATCLTATSLAVHAKQPTSADSVKAQSCLTAFVDRFLPGQSPVATLNSENSDRSLVTSRHFEMALTATRDGRVIASAVCKVEQGVTSITPSVGNAIAMNN
jgi:hypothetical protein